MILADFPGSARLSRVKPLRPKRTPIFCPPIRDLGAARDACGLRITVVARVTPVAQCIQPGGLMEIKPPDNATQ